MSVDENELPAKDQARFRVPMPKEQNPLAQFALARELQRLHAEERSQRAEDEMPLPEPPAVEEAFPNRPKVCLPETEAKIRAKERRNEPEQQAWNKSKDPLAMLAALREAIGRPFFMQPARFFEEFMRASAWIYGDWGIAEKLLPKKPIQDAGQMLSRGNAQKTLELLAPLRRFHRNPKFVEMCLATTIRALAPEVPPNWPSTTGALGPDDQLGTF